MVKKGNKIIKNTIFLWVSVFIFIIFSTVLFINNLTDLLTKFNVPFNINLITWAGLILSMGWLIFLVIHRQFLK